MKPESHQRRAVRILSFLYAIENNPYKYLKEKGYKGRIGISHSCPISNCLKEEFDLDFVESDIHYIIINGSENYLDTPGRIADFIKEFDDGLYPDLDIERQCYD